MRLKNQTMLDLNLDQARIKIQSMLQKQMFRATNKEFDKKATIRIFIHAWTYDVSTAIN